MWIIETRRGGVWSWTHSADTREAALCETREAAESQLAVVSRGGGEHRVRETNEGAERAAREMVALESRGLYDLVPGYWQRIEQALAQYGHYPAVSGDAHKLIEAARYEAAQRPA